MKEIPEYRIACNKVAGDALIPHFSASPWRKFDINDKATWPPCEDEMWGRSGSKRCLVVIGKYNIETARFWFHRKKWQVTVNPLEDFDITHWMPLPELPNDSV